jgi:predicted ester cyclase
MSAEANKAVVRREVEFWNTENWAIFDEIYPPSYVGHDPDGLQDHEAFRQYAAGLFAAFSEVNLVIDDLLADGDKVVKRWTVTCKHTGELMGVPPTGKEIKFTGINIFRIIGGKIEEQWVESDALGLMQQLGIIPALG